MAYKLEIPYSEEDKLNFIVTYNHQQSLKLEMLDDGTLFALKPNEILVDGKVSINPKYEQELAEKLAEVDQRANEDAIYREGEYQNDRKRIQEEYQALIDASNELYKIGQKEDARVVQDAWVNSYDYIIDKGNEWQGAIKDYTDNINEAFREWETNTNILTDLVGKDLDEVAGKVDDVVWASEQLRDKVVDDVIPGLEVELTAVRTLTEGWAQHRDELYENIRAYEELAKYAMDQIAEKSGYSGFDMDADYSTLMANSVYGSREYEQYKAYRQ